MMYMKYVALLRGIAPANPDMRNERLRWMFEQIGFKEVMSVLSSGNIIFEASDSDNTKLEAKIEKAFPKLLGYECSTIIKSKEDLEELVKLDPFSGLEHSPKTSLNVTFIKIPVKTNWTFPYTPEGKDYLIENMTENAVFSVTDVTAVKTPNLMSWLEKQFGKQITTRTWKTVNRILQKMG
jgi:uncharacterized protein (DUF1697 family)